MARILSIDFGERRIGMAVSDPTATIATPLPTLRRRRGKRPPIREIMEVATAREVEEVVIGLPLALDGSETDWTREVRDFGTRLSERSGLPVSYIDERLTSVQAEQAVRRLGLRKAEREDRSRVDAAAAMLILQSFLDRRSRR